MDSAAGVATRASLAVFLLQQLGTGQPLSTHLDALQGMVNGTATSQAASDALLTVLQSEDARRALAAVPADSAVGKMQAGLAAKR